MIRDSIGHQARLIPPLPVPSSLQVTKTRRNYLGCNAGRLVITQILEASVDSFCREIITLCRHAIYVTSHILFNIYDICMIAKFCK